MIIGGTFQATTAFQESDFSQKAKAGVEILQVEYDFSPFRIQTLTCSHPCLVLRPCFAKRGRVHS